jgi:hypothetical protein
VLLLPYQQRDSRFAVFFQNDSPAPSWPTHTPPEILTPTCTHSHMSVTLSLTHFLSHTPLTQADESSDALLLRVTTKDQLMSHLHAILASPDKSLATIQRRIAKAFLVFGEDTTCARLHATLVGGGPGQGAETAAAAGANSGECGPSNLPVCALTNTRCSQLTGNTRLPAHLVQQPADSPVCLPACLPVFTSHKDNGGSTTTAAAGDAVADTSPQDLHTRLAGEFNRRWQLMSLMIDHACL